MGMKSRARLHALATFTSLVAALSSAGARAQTFGQAEICDPTTRTVDRERLALAALAAAGVSTYPYRWIGNEVQPAGVQQSVAQRLLSFEDFCRDGEVSANGIPRCGPDDADRLGTAQNFIIRILEDTEKYTVPEGITGPASLFAASNSAVLCRPSASGSLAGPAPTSLPAPFDQSSVPLRLRGNTDTLQFDRNRDSAFAGAEKASITFKSDREGGKDTLKANFVAGIVLPLQENTLELVPYFAFQTDTSQKDGQEKEVNEDVIRAGALLDFRTHGAGISHLFLLRPEYAFNDKEDSEVITANFTYQPLINGWLNDAINITTSDNRSLFSVIPRIDLRATAGDFTELGTRLAADSQDFIRVGGQIGFTIASDIKWLPLELSINETYLYALEGEPDDLSYLKGVFSLYFDEKKYLGIDLGYARGRRDDLSKREHNWTIGFGAKF